MPTCSGRKKRGRARLRTSFCTTRSHADGQEARHRRPIARPRSDVVESDDPGRIDEHITAELECVGAARARQLAARQLFQIRPHRPRPPDVADATRQHPVRAIQLPCFVHEQRPREPCLRDVMPREGRRLERDHGNLGVQRFERLPVLLQLQQVPLAGQSTEMTVEDEEDPALTVVREPVDAAVGIGQRERNCRLAGQAGHSALACLTFRHAYLTTSPSHFLMPPARL
jgi:hypothetical protein